MAEPQATTVPPPAAEQPQAPVVEQPQAPAAQEPPKTEAKPAELPRNFIPFVEQNTTGRVDFSEAYDKTQLKGRSALVTGGAVGIGRGCTEGLAEAGVYVTFCDVQEEVGREAEKEMRAKGLNVQFVQTDVTSWAALVNAFKACVEFSPSKTVDIVIPNAGVAAPALYFWLTQTPLDEKNDPKIPPSRTVDVNYMAVYNTVHAALYYFKNFPGTDSSKSKVIIFVSSMGGFQPMASVIDYNSSKWGVRGMFWSLRNCGRILGEGKPGFRVNLIAPTWVRTNMTRGLQSRLEEGNSTIKIAEVSDCVDVVLRMASDENVRGRAAAIAAEKKSFDLCDDSEGLGVGKVLSDPEYLKHFGYGPAAEQPKPKAEETKENGATAVAAPAENGTAEGEPKVANGITVEHKVEDAPAKTIEIPQALPKEVANTA